MCLICSARDVAILYSIVQYAFSIDRCACWLGCIVWLVSLVAWCGALEMVAPHMPRAWGTLSWATPPLCATSCTVPSTQACFTVPTVARQVSRHRLSVWKVHVHPHLDIASKSGGYYTRVLCHHRRVLPPACEA
jgi:hypothetical protein